MSFSSVECWLFAMLVIAVQVAPSVYGLSCGVEKKYCSDHEYCCGFRNSECCTRSNPGMDAVVVMLFFFFFFVCCPIMCFRGCRRRTARGGVVYSPAGTTNPVTVSLIPPQHNQQQPAPYPQQLPYPQPAPYPTMLQYPQQDPINPYYGGPPPPDTLHGVTGNLPLPRPALNPQQTPYPHQDHAKPPLSYNQVMAQISVPDTTRIVPQAPPDPDH